MMSVSRSQMLQDNSKYSVCKHLADVKARGTLTAGPSESGSGLKAWAEWFSGVISSQPWQVKLCWGQRSSSLQVCPAARWRQTATTPPVYMVSYALHWVVEEARFIYKPRRRICKSYLATLLLFIKMIDRKDTFKDKFLNEHGKNYELVILNTNLNLWHLRPAATLRPFLLKIHQFLFLFILYLFKFF